MLTERNGILDKLNAMKIKSIFSKGDSLLSQGLYDESIKTYKKGLLLDEDYKKSTLDRIWTAFIAKSNSLAANNKYQQALDNLEIYSEFDNNYESRNNIKSEQSKIYVKEAEFFVSSSDYINAINKLDKSKELNSKPSDKWYSLYAASNFKYGMDEIKANKIENGLKLLSVAAKLDNNYRNIANTELNKMKRSETMMGFASVIPGLGQYIQGDYSGVLLITSSVSFLIYNGIKRGNEGLSEKQNINFLSAGLILAYGIWDSYNTAKAFNNSLNLNDNVRITYFGNFINLTVKL